MSEYIKLLAKNGIRFTGSPVTMSPQLDDYGIQNFLQPISSERKVEFRVILYVPSLECNEVRIVFPTDDTMEVHMEHGLRKMGKRHLTKVLWSRDCRYIYRLPEGVSKSRLTATWTNDSFLVIQSRDPRPLDASYENEDVVDQLIPSKVCGILRPHLDLSVVKDMLYLHQTEVDEICDYLETKGVVPEDRDVLGMLKNYPGKTKRSLKPLLQERKALEESKDGQKLEVESEMTNLEETAPEKEEQPNQVDTAATTPA